MAISGEDPGNGVCVFKNKPVNPFSIAQGPGTVSTAWQHTLTTSRADLRISLAGPLAEAKILRKPLRSLGAESDLEKCLLAMPRLKTLMGFASQYVNIVPLDIVKMMEEERVRTVRWLSRPSVWKTVGDIAFVLTQRGKIDGEELGYIIGRSRQAGSQSQLCFL